MTICHSAGVATHVGRDALQRDKRNCQIGLKIESVLYKIKKPCKVFILQGFLN
jgi:hypothetical protein